MSSHLPTGFVSWTHCAVLAMCVLFGLISPVISQHADNSSWWGDEGYTTTSTVDENLAFILVAFAEAISGDSLSVSGLHEIQASLLIQQLRKSCDDSSGPPDPLMGPLPFELNINGDDVSREKAGALVGNTVCVIFFGLFRLIGRRFLTCLERRWPSSNKSPSSDADSTGGYMQGFVSKMKRSLNKRFKADHISTFWPVYTPLLCPSICACYILLKRDSGGALLGAALLVCWVVPWMAAALIVRWNKYLRHLSTSFSFWTCKRRRGSTKKKRKSLRKRRTCAPLFRVVHGVKMMFLDPTEKISFRSDEWLVSLEQNYGSVVQGLRSSRLWYFNVDLFFRFVMGIVIGVIVSDSDPSACSENVFGWILVTLGLLEWLAILLIRPYCTNVDFLSILVINGLCVASQFLTLSEDDADDADSHTNKMDLAAAGCQLSFSILVAANDFFCGEEDSDVTTSSSAVDPRTARGNETLRREATSLDADLSKEDALPHLIHMICGQALSSNSRATSPLLVSRNSIRPPCPTADDPFEARD
jgi:hypothetical protein